MMLAWAARGPHHLLFFLSKTQQTIPNPTQLTSPHPQTPARRAPFLTRGLATRPPRHPPPRFPTLQTGSDPPPGYSGASTTERGARTRTRASLEVPPPPPPVRGGHSSLHTAGEGLARPTTKCLGCSVTVRCSSHAVWHSEGGCSIYGGGGGP